MINPPPGTILGHVHVYIIIPCAWRWQSNVRIQLTTTQTDSGLGFPPAIESVCFAGRGQL